MKRIAHWSDDYRRRMQAIGRNNAARYTDADFVPSLRLLVCRERYSLDDIGMMFGVSRERVRQWCARHNIEHPDTRGLRGLMVTRVWNDATNRFDPVPRRELRRAKREAALAERERFLAARRGAMIEACVALKKRLGCDPTWAEMLTAVRGDGWDRNAAPKMVALWDTKSRPTREKYASLVAALAAAGVYVRSSGTPGHRGDDLPRPVEIVKRQVFDHADGAPSGSRRGAA